jgi:hypothetical protein
LLRGNLLLSAMRYRIHLHTKGPILYLLVVHSLPHFTPFSTIASPSVHHCLKMAADLGDAHRNPGASLLEDDFEFVETPKAPQPVNSTNYGVRTTSVCRLDDSAISKHIWHRHRLWLSY